MTEQGKRQAREEGPAPGDVEQRAEQDEQHDELRHHRHRNAEDAVAAQGACVSVSRFHDAGGP